MRRDWRKDVLCSVRLGSPLDIQGHESVCRVIVFYTSIGYSISWVGHVFLYQMGKGFFYSLVGWSSSPIKNTKQQLPLDIKWCVPKINWCFTFEEVIIYYRLPACESSAKVASKLNEKNWGNILSFSQWGTHFTLNAVPELWPKPNMLINNLHKDVN